MADSLLDQSVQLQKAIWKETLQHVDTTIERAVQSGSDEFIAELLGIKIKSIRIEGVAMAKLLANWKEHASDFEILDDDWVDHAMALTGLSVSTIRKYVDLWNNVFEVVDEEKFWALVGKPIQALLLLPAAVKEGQLDDDDWIEIAGAEDGMAIRDVVRRARGDATSSGTAIQLVVGRDGIITAWKGGEVASVGFVKLDSPDPIVEAAVTRILGGAGIRRE